MATFKVALTRTYILEVEAETAQDAVDGVEFYVRSELSLARLPRQTRPPALINGMEYHEMVENSAELMDDDEDNE